MGHSPDETLTLGKLRELVERLKDEPDNCEIRVLDDTGPRGVPVATEYQMAINRANGKLVRLTFRAVRGFVPSSVIPLGTTVREMWEIARV